MGRIRLSKIRLKSLRLPRTALAFVLTALAIAVPCAAWFVAGQNGIDRSSRLEERSLHEKAQAKAHKWAGRLGKRLSVLHRAENHRPFYLYQNLYHDPKGAAEGASVSVSPLAQGPGHPWIAAHFQIDEQGLLRLPTLNDEFPELSLPDASAQCALLSGLEEIALFCGELSGSPDGISCNTRLDPMQIADPTLTDSANARKVHRIYLSEEAWWQHLQANTLYADLKNKRRTIVPNLRKDGDLSGQIQVDVGAFRWHTLPVGEKPALVALRDVSTPIGIWTQGFVIDQLGVEQALFESRYPASFVPMPHHKDLDEQRVASRVAGTSWSVVLDLSEELDQISLSNAEDRDRFLRTFILSALAAGLAGLLVVGMVYQAERLAEQRSRFAANAAHELRTPLAGLRLYGEMLAEGLGNPDNARVYAQRMASEAERLGRVVTNVLGFTRLERHILNVKPELGDLRAAVEETTQRHRPTLEEAGADFDVDLPESLPMVRFDRDAIAQILQNLLDNAEKYTRDVENRRINVQLEQQDNNVALTVQDNGRGINRKVRKRLFRPFSRGGDRDAPEGLGLGLMLVKALVTAQRGEISYSDAPAGGAMFTIRLPVTAG